MSEQSETLYDQALDLIQSGDLSRSISVIEESLMEDAKDPLTWRLYGVVLAAANRPDDAAAAMEKAESFGLDGVDSLLMQAAKAQMDGNLDKAISCFEDALEIDGSRAEIWSGYALALVQGGYHKDALDASEKALDLESDHAQTWYARGRVLRITENPQQAVEAYDAAVRLDAGLGVAWHERGMVQVALGRFAEAAESFQKVLELVPGDPSATEALKIVRAELP